MKLHNNPQIAELLAKPFWAELEITVRTYNSLEAANIKTLRELVTKEEKNLLEDSNFAPTSVDEIKEQLAKLGLTLGMDLENDDVNILELLRGGRLPTV